MAAIFLVITILSGAFTAINFYASDYATATAQLMITVASAVLFTRETKVSE